MTGEEPVRFGSTARRLAGRVAVPAGARAGAVVCHPHPQYGGDMGNPVVTAVCRALTEAGLAALRFDFGPFSGGEAEVDDARCALEALAARLPAGAAGALVGYSFGAWVALRVAAAGARVATVVAIAPPLGLLAWEFLDRVVVPVTVVVGDRDPLCPREQLAPHALRVQIVPGADHFLAGREAEVARLAVDPLRARTG